MGGFAGGVETGADDDRDQARDRPLRDANFD